MNKYLIEQNNLTGDKFHHEKKIITYPFDQYLLKIEIDENDRFIGVIEISLNKDFYDYKTETFKGFQDIEDFYKDED